MEDSIENDDYENYLDVHSFAAWNLVHDIVGQRDSGGTNKFFTKNGNKNQTAARWS